MNKIYDTMFREGRKIFSSPEAKRANRETPRPCSSAEGQATTGGS